MTARGTEEVCITTSRPSGASSRRFALAIDIARFFMQEQCGQCPPCRMETNQFVHVLEAVRAGKGPGYQEKLQKLAEFDLDENQKKAVRP